MGVAQALGIVAREPLYGLVPYDLVRLAEECFGGLAVQAGGGGRPTGWRYSSAWRVCCLQWAGRTEKICAAMRFEI